MVILVIVAGFFLFIKPKFEKVNLAKDTLAAKQQEKIDIDTKIGTLVLLPISTSTVIVVTPIIVLGYTGAATPL